MTRFLIMIASFITINSAVALDSNNLILNCQEYIAIYNLRDKKRLMAAISTSPAEAMRAGICRGVLEEHARHERYSCSGNLFKQAQYIAKRDSNTYRHSLETLLDRACEQS